MRESVRIIRHSGKIEELTEAVHGATLAARDSAKEINEVTNELKQKGVSRETISAEKTGAAMRDAPQTMRDNVSREAAKDKTTVPA